jgi:hypothetical protein
MSSNLNPPAIDVVESNKKKLPIKQLRLPEALAVARLLQWHGHPIDAKHASSSHRVDIVGKESGGPGKSTAGS